MNVRQHPSPNHSARPVGVAVDCVVLHATADSDTIASVRWCCTPKPGNPNPVSYHSIIDRDGTAYYLVDPARRAWHAGVSSYKGRTDVNDFSIGLSFGNKNDGVEKYTDEQYRIGAALVAQWMQRFPKISIDRITTHAEIAPGRKTDPVKFDMVRFRTLVAVELAELKAKAAL
jgi:N-acetyl-anhydromuramyl-L-alanine amidase AmpD